MTAQNYKEAKSTIIFRFTIYFFMFTLITHFISGIFGGVLAVIICRIAVRPVLNKLTLDD